jgi:hypothetical protein
MYFILHIILSIVLFDPIRIGDLFKTAFIFMPTAQSTAVASEWQVESKPGRNFCEKCLNTGLIKCSTCAGALTNHRKSCESAKAMSTWRGAVYNKNVIVCKNCKHNCEDEDCEFGHTLVICTPCRKGRQCKSATSDGRAC